MYLYVFIMYIVLKSNYLDEPWGILLESPADAEMPHSPVMSLLKNLKKYLPAPSLHQTGGFSSMFDQFATSS